MIQMVTKQMFFDTKAVMRATDKATRRVLSKFGAFVRRSARSSIRKRKRTSAPASRPARTRACCVGSSGSATTGRSKVSSSARCG